jgi:hypothetical protein
VGSTCQVETTEEDIVDGVVVVCKQRPALLRQRDFSAVRLNVVSTPRLSSLDSECRGSSSFAVRYSRHTIFAKQQYYLKPTSALGSSIFGKDVTAL